MADTVCTESFESCEFLRVGSESVELCCCSSNLHESICLIIYWPVAWHDKNNNDNNTL